MASKIHNDNAATMTRTDLSGVSFLVVDDDQIVRTMLISTLRKAGCGRILEALDGVSAIKALEQSDKLVNCIVSDLSMRPMHGLYLLQAVRSGVTRLARDTPFLLVTSHGDAHFMRASFKLDVHAFLTKPTPPAELVEKVGRALVEPIELSPKQHYAGIALPADLSEPMPEDAEAETSSEAPRKAAPAVVQRLATVKPGETLARDISANGQLILGAGNVLTKSAIRRLIDLAAVYPDLAEIWIEEPPPEAKETKRAK